MGMLMTTAYILAMDTFGPITDNAGGIAEFSKAEAERPRDHRPPRRRRQHDQGAHQGLRHRVRRAGRVPAVQRLHRPRQQHPAPTRARPLDGPSVNLADVQVFVAALIAAMLVYFFSSLAIRAVGTTAQSIIVEVRRQFREMPGIMDYTQRPGLRTGRGHHHEAALKQMILPGAVAVATPIVVGLLLGYRGRRRLADGGHHRRASCSRPSSTTRAVPGTTPRSTSSPGNLKDEAGNVLGKRTDAHAAAVVGDTVGDPFKDTAGPSLHVLIKLLATITLVLAPLFIR